MPQNTGKLRVVYEYGMIALGVLILALSISLFFEPHQMVTGGVTGFAIAFQGMTRPFGFVVPLWVTNTAVNIPLLLFAWKMKGFNFIAKTLFGTGFLSVCLFFTQMIPIIDTDIFIAMVFGGISAGVGVGIVIRFSGTTGGSDLGGYLIHQKVPHIQMSRLIFIIDAAVIMLGIITFGFTKSFYAVIAVFLSAKGMDAVLEGLNFSKAAFIISDAPYEISQAIIKELDRSATILDGKGAYSMQEKKVVLSVVSTKEIIMLKQITSRLDKNAFMIMADVREVYGLGFRDLEDK